MRYNLVSKRDFHALAAPLLESDGVQRMDRLEQHGTLSTLGHCISVAYVSYRLANLLPFRVDQRSIVRGALLHDYFLYDHNSETQYHLPEHLFQHPQTALTNAKREFQLNAIEENIIASHMWPLTITKVPRCREAAVVCFADTWCAMMEMMICVSRKIRRASAWQTLKRVCFAR